MCEIFASKILCDALHYPCNALFQKNQSYHRIFSCTFTSFFFSFSFFSFSSSISCLVFLVDAFGRCFLWRRRPVLVPAFLRFSNWSRGFRFSFLYDFWKSIVDHFADMVSSDPSSRPTILQSQGYHIGLLCPLFLLCRGLCVLLWISECSFLWFLKVFWWWRSLLLF